MSINNKRKGGDLAAEERPAKRQRATSHQQLIDRAVFRQFRKIANADRAKRGAPILETKVSDLMDLTEADCQCIWDQLLNRAEKYSAWKAKMTEKLSPMLDGALGELRMEISMKSLADVREKNRLLAAQRRDEAKAPRCSFDNGRCTSRDGRTPGFCFSHDTLCSAHLHLDLCRGCYRSASVGRTCTDCKLAAAKICAPKMATDSLSSILSFMRSGGVTPSPRPLLWV